VGAFQPWHIIIVVVVAVMLFGTKRLPDSARALGQSLRIFKAELRAAQHDTAHIHAALPAPQATLDEGRPRPAIAPTPAAPAADQLDHRPS